MLPLDVGQASRLSPEFGRLLPNALPEANPQG